MSVILPVEPVPMTPVERVEFELVVDREVPIVTLDMGALHERLMALLMKAGKAIAAIWWAFLMIQPLANPTAIMRQLCPSYHLRELVTLVSVGGAAVATTTATASTTATGE